MHTILCDSPCDNTVYLAVAQAGVAKYCDVSAHALFVAMENELH